MAVIEMKFYSEMLKKQTMVNVVLPEIRKRSKDVPIKVLYLLHGLSDNHTAWCCNTSIERYAAKYNIAVIMPDVGRSWYTDTPWGENYFSYITKELPNACRVFFAGLSDKREDTYIAGLSMGGYGAVKAAMLYPELYAGCVSLSGSLDITRKGRACDIALWRTLFKSDMESPLELEGSCYDLFYQARRNAETKTKVPNIFMWCGTEDSLLECNRSYDKLLTELGIFHEYRESEGDHSWKWWDKHIVDGLDYILGFNE